jgi:hypothetical protein
MRATETPKPQQPETEILLRRVEERIERIPLSPDQIQERMKAAAGVFAEAAVLDREVASARESLKDLKQRAASKHSDGEAIVADANSGTTAAPYPVIVERHPLHSAEMVVWRTPDGIEPASLIDALTAETDAEYTSAREAQGCTLVEVRAMTPDELDIARREDWARTNPELPFPETTATTGTGRTLGAIDGGKGSDVIPITGATEEDEDGEEEEGEQAASDSPAEDGDVVAVRAVLANLNVGETITALAIVGKTNIGTERVQNALRVLRTEGYAEKVGAGRGTSYQRAVAVPPVTLTQGSVEPDYEAATFEP